MSADFKIFGDTTLSDLFEKIDNNSKRNKIQIESIIQEVMTFIKDPNTAIQLFPMIAEYMQANIKNDEVLVKMAAVIQRVLQVELKNADGEFGLSEKEKEDILAQIETATDGLQKEVDDIQLGISESGS
tara:strand:- start:53 stop:439 length:387 start_codon:yes stop_codon:yes gene_type:complete